MVVAAIGKCSRPEQLKAFLYLDFIDRDKRDNVLKKLVNTISMCHYLQWNLSNQDTLKKRHLDKQYTFGYPKHSYMYIQPLKSGHLTSMDTFFHLKGTREVPL